jgi:mRNA interferase MazF
MSNHKRGEVWLVDLGYAAKTRPCLVLSEPPSLSDRALVSLIPHTTQPRNTAFEVTCTSPFLKRGVFDTQNIVTVSIAKMIRRLGTLTSSQIADVEQGVKAWLGIAP